MSNSVLRTFFIKMTIAILVVKRIQLLTLIWDAKRDFSV